MSWTYSGSPSPTHMAVLGTTLYTLSSGVIMTTDLSNGDSMDVEWCIGFSSDSYIVADPTTSTLYVSDSTTSAVYSVNGNGTSTEFFSPNAELGDIFFSFPTAMYIANGFLYVAHLHAGFIPSICRISLADPTTYNLQWAQSVNLGGTVGMCANNGTMYVACNNSPPYNDPPSSTVKALISVNMSTGVVTPVAPLFNTGTMTDMIIYNNVLYISRGNTIQKVSLAGTILNPTWKTVPFCGGLVVYGTDIYATNSDGGDIYKFTLIVVPCFKEGTKILTDKGYVPVEHLRKGHLVKTLLNKYKPIYMIGTKEISHPASAERISNQLYVANWKEVPELVEDLVITGSHCTLVDEFKEGEEEKTIGVNGKIYVTDKKYRVPACVDSRFSVYEPAGEYTIYHFALENDNYLMNYGIYANGLLVETCSKRCIQEYSKLKIIE